MPSTPSPLLRTEQQAKGEKLNVWGDDLNAVFLRIEEAIAGPLTLTITGNRTLTADNYVANEYRRGIHTLVAGTGLAAPFTITVPALAYPYRIDNRTAFAATLKTALGTGVAVVRPGMISVVFCDGTDCKVADPTLDQVKTAAANVAMGGFKFTGLADGSAPNDSITYGQVTALTGTLVTAQASAAAAAGSASAASTSATNAAASASSATNSASIATNTASSASGSAAAAGTSATNASNSATAAAGSATAANTSAGNAATSATNAGNSATAAATSATNAGGSATAAQTARVGAEAAYDSFDDRYLGPKSSDPTTDNDGNAILVGALYFNTTTNTMRQRTSGNVWADSYATVAGGNPPTKVEVFDANGTWAKDTAAKLVGVYAKGGDGGGGSGARQASGVNSSGGGGGGGAGWNFAEFQASTLPASVPVLVGAAGLGGASVTTDSTVGNAGTAGGNSAFGTIADTCFVPGWGANGGSVAGGASGAGGTSRNAGAGGGSGGTATGAPPVVSDFSAGGGGGGAGQAVAGPASNNGGNGGYPRVFGLTAPTTGGVGATKTAAIRANFPDGDVFGLVGSGCGGGWSNADGTAGAGASTSSGKAGGGGGGGASLNGNPSGKGGDGGAGRVVVVTYY